MKKMTVRLVTYLVALAGLAVCGAEGAFPRVWTSTSGCRTVEEFERMAADCAAHGVQVMESRHLGGAKDDNRFGEGNMNRTIGILQDGCAL